MSVLGRRSRRRERSRHRTTGPMRIREWAVPVAGTMLTLLLALLGGASRNDLWVQPVVQVGAIVIAAAMMMQAPEDPLMRSTGESGQIAPLAWVIAALAAVMAFQLVPLPPAIWRALPNRGLEADISNAVGLADLWRPLSIVPDNGLSALLGMVVPATVLIVFVRTPQRLIGRLMWLVAAIAAMELMLGLGQLATGRGALFFYSRTAGTVTGSFHNRNHLAIFLGTMPAVVAYIALAQRDRMDRREPLWAGFALAIALAAFGVVLTGSRIGVAVLVLATAGAGLMVWRTEPRVRARVSRPTTRRTRIAVIAGSAVACALLLGTVLVRSDTALTRLGATNLGEEGRVGIFRTLLELAGRYFPVGSGFGTFDRAFRMIEPEEKLRLSFLNHAHNDLIEVVIEGGFASVILSAVMAVLAARAAAVAWRGRGPFDPDRDLARTGSIVAAGLLLGSVSDYPLRTPMLAGWMTLALCLLIGGRTSAPRGRDDARRRLAGLDATGGLV